MAGVICFAGMASTPCYPAITHLRCCANSSTNTSHSKKKQTPQLLKFAVNGVTELLRLFSFVNNNNNISNIEVSKDEEFFINGVDDVLDVLKMDYDNAYFVTGVFTSSIYAEDCLFADPTINFRGRELYSRNLQLLVPFFEQPSIVLKSIVKGVDDGRDYVLATWSLRTFLKLPWRPLIAIEGSTIYDLNREYKIVRHVERWNVSAVEAVTQIFTSASNRSLD